MEGSPFPEQQVRTTVRERDESRFCDHRRATVEERQGPVKIFIHIPLRIYRYTYFSGRLKCGMQLSFIVKFWIFKGHLKESRDLFKHDTKYNLSLYFNCVNIERYFNSSCIDRNF